LSFTYVEILRNIFQVTSATSLGIQIIAWTEHTLFLVSLKFYFPMIYVILLLHWEIKWQVNTICVDYNCVFQIWFNYLTKVMCPWEHKADTDNKCSASSWRIGLLSASFLQMQIPLCQLSYLAFPNSFPLQIFLQIHRIHRIWSWLLPPFSSLKGKSLVEWVWE
jgi:hypothetical protein